VSDGPARTAATAMLDREARRYAAYGLAIQSAMPLPELPATEGTPDVRIALGPVDGLPREAREAERYASGDLHTCHVFIRDIGTCLVRDGREMVVEPAPAVEARVLRLLVLGPGLAMVVRQRGRLLLHASAVAIGESAVAFLGGPGWGKSTVAEAFHAAGHRVVDDDVLAADTDGTVPLAIPGFPRLKLYPDVAAHFGADVARLPRLHPRLGKLGRAVIPRFAPAPLPLRRLYVLAEGDTVALEPLAPGDALVEMIRHAYGASLLRAAVAGRHFQQCGVVARRVPARRLWRPRALAELPRLVRQVERDLADD
jgi:hypothetical protein